MKGSKPDAVGAVLTMDQIVSGLRARYPREGWALFFEVRNGTGHARRARTADAVAVSLWPSRGLEIHGMEIKLTRSDWRRELKQPEKADAIARYCDRWYLVVGDSTIVEDWTIPPAWGLYGPRGSVSKLRALRAAEKLEPQPIDRLFFASLIRKFQDGMVSRTEIGQELEAAATRAHADERLHAKVVQTRYERLQEQLLRFEAASGIRLGENSWYSESPEKEASAFKLVRGHGVGRVTAAIAALPLLDKLDGIRAAARDLLVACGEPMKDNT